MYMLRLDFFPFDQVSKLDKFAMQCAYFIYELTENFRHSLSILLRVILSIYFD